MKKIAFCFLIYDEINHEDLWNIFFKNIDENKYNIYIHYKTNKPLKYFDKYKIDNCIETLHGEVSIVKAQIILLKKGLDDNNTIFCFLSGHCIPLKSFNYIYNTLDENYSYFNVSSDSECFPRCNLTLNFLSKNLIKKSNAMYIINKKLVNLLIENEQLMINWFNNVKSADEHCVITLVYYLKLENEIITTPNLSNDATTFTNWGDMGYKYESGYGLKNYDTIEKEEVVYLLNSKCLFGRKFNTKCYSDLSIKEYLENISTTGV